VRVPFLKTAWAFTSSTKSGSENHRAKVPIRSFYPVKFLAQSLLPLPAHPLKMRFSDYDMSSNSREGSNPIEFIPAPPW
jgi:hypothetical protein